MSNLFFFNIFSWLLKDLACESLCSELLYTDWVVFVPDTLEESAGEVATRFLTPEHLASIPGDLVLLISKLLAFFKKIFLISCGHMYGVA